MENRRKTIVINRRFQYQYALLVVAMAVILVNVFLVLRLLSGGEPLVLDMGTFIGIAFVELFLVAGIWYGSLVASHRIAGPVHVFNREISRIGNGDLTSHIAVRETDMFRQEAQAMNQSIAALRQRVAAIKATAAELAEAGGDNSALLQRLQDDLAALKTD